MTMSLRPQTKKQDKNIPSGKVPASFLLKRVRAFVVFCLVISTMLFSVSCSSPEKEVTRSFFALDTYITITLRGKDSERAINSTVDCVIALERKLSRQETQSEISMLNQSSESSPVTLSKETYELLSKTV